MAAGPMPGWASYSAIGSFRACPQRWNYAYLHKLSKPVYEQVVARWNELGFTGKPMAVSVFEDSDGSDSVE